MHIKSEDAAGLSNFLLKCLYEKTKQAILDIYNKILDDRMIPKEWKSSQITMISKNSGDSNSVSGYRPISVTECLARLLERLILARLQEHLDKKKIILIKIIRVPPT